MPPILGDEKASLRNPREVQGPGAPGLHSKRLFVDMSVISARDAGTGIQRVVRSIWSNLVMLCPHGLELVAVGATPKEGYSVIALQNLPRSKTSFAAGDEIFLGEGDIFLGLDLAAHLMPRHEGQIAEWRHAGAEIHILVYDLLPVVMRRYFKWRTRRKFARWLHVVGRQADGVICISSTVASDLQHWLARHARRPRAAIRFGTIRLGYDFAGSQPSGGFPHGSSAILDRISNVPTILMVGTIEPRKAYDVALAAFAHLWRQPSGAPLQLLVVGHPGWKTKRLQARMRKLQKNCAHFLWLDDVSDEFLAHIYRRARGLLFCSHGEGFGLPLVEAASAGLPILTRDLPVFRELAIPLTYFSDDRPRGLAAAITATFECPNVMTINASLPLSSWQQATQDILSFILDNDATLLQRRKNFSRTGQGA